MSALKAIERTKEFKPTLPKVTAGFFIGNEKNPQKKSANRSKIDC